MALRGVKAYALLMGLGHWERPVGQAHAPVTYAAAYCFDLERRKRAREREREREKVAIPRKLANSLQSGGFHRLEKLICCRYQAHDAESKHKTA